MKIITMLFAPTFSLFVSMYKRVCAIRKDDTPGQENALFLMLLALALAVAAGFGFLAWKIPFLGG